MPLASVSTLPLAELPTMAGAAKAALASSMAATAAGISNFFID